MVIYMQLRSDGATEFECCQDRWAVLCDEGAGVVGRFA